MWTIEALPGTDSRASKRGSEDTNQVVIITPKPRNPSGITTAIDRDQHSQTYRGSTGARKEAKAVFEIDTRDSSQSGSLLYCAADLWEDVCFSVEAVLTCCLMKIRMSAIAIRIQTFLLYLRECLQGSSPSLSVI